MTRFVAPINEPFTRTVALGPCECPGTPHPDGDTAEVYRVLGWDDLYDVGAAANVSAGAGMRLLVARALASWTLQDDLGVVAITEASVRLLNQATTNAIVEAANEAYERATTPLPNGSGEVSPASPPEPDTSTPTIPTTAKPTN